MMRPMMVMTTRISTSVKPRSPWRPLGRRRIRLSQDLVSPIMSPSPHISSDDLGHRQQRGHDRYDDAADHDADGDDRERTNDADHPVEAALQLGFVKLGHAT